MPNPLDTVRQVVSVDDALIALGLGEDKYNEVERYVNAVSRFFEAYARTRFKKRRLVLTLDAPWSPILDLGSPVVAVYSVTVDGSAVLASDYKVLSERGQLYRDSGWVESTPLWGSALGVRNIVVDADLGYDPVPEDVQEAAIAMVRFWRAKAGGVATGVYQSERIGEYSYTIADPSKAAGQLGLVTVDAPGEVLSVLNNYVRWGV